MIILIAGATHTGKTLLAQKLLEKYHYPYLSIDHLKIGLIRSKNTELTVNDDDKLVDYLWNIVKEIIKTAIENKQNLIVEGGYIPFDYQKDFTIDELKNIKYQCLVMTMNYLDKHLIDIVRNASVIEYRGKDDTKIRTLIDENTTNLAECKKHNLPYILIDDKYDIDLSVFD